MDKLGLPVCASIRPRGKTLCVHAGKGTELVDARVGAAMEAIEYAIAEPDATSWTPIRTTVGELLQQIEGQFIDFAPRLGVNVLSDDPLDGVYCENLLTGQKCVLPAQLIFMPYLPADLKNFFGGTTNGLASGNSIEEATIHALFEVLERDTISINKVRDKSRLIDAGTLPPIFRRYVESWARLGVSLAVRYIENDFGLPCFQAYIAEEESDTVNLSTGQGLHVDPLIALSRAICEAAQSRLSHIHGGRDDITHFYSKYAKWDKSERMKIESQVKQRAFCAERLLGFDAVPRGALNNSADTFYSATELLFSLVKLIQAKGLGPVYRYTFSHNVPAISVVKVVVAKAEHVEHNLKRIGARMLAAITNDA